MSKKQTNNVTNDNVPYKSRIELFKKAYQKRNVKPKNAMQTTLRLIKYLVDEKRLMYVVIMLIFISSIGALASSYFYRLVIDKFIVAMQLKNFAFYSFILLMIYLINIFSSYAGSLIMIGISQRTLRKMRKELFSKMQSLSISFFDKNRDGDLMSRITNDVDNISNTMTQTVTEVISSVLMLVGTMTLMFIMSWQLTLVALATIPLIYFAAKFVSKYSTTRFRRLRYELGALNAFVAEQINGSKVIQSFVQEQQIVNEFTIESKKAKRTTIDAVTWAGVMEPIMGFLNNLRYIIIVSTGAILVIYGYTSVGTIFTFVILARVFGGQISQLANLYTDIQNALSGAERIFDILDDQSEIKNHHDAIVLQSIKGHVELRNVSFGYLPEVLVLKNVSIDAQPGMKIALVGHTGAGKTTIINLITRFYEINEGEILIDGINIKEISKESLLEHVGIVLQDTNLFSDTIYNNIRYGKLDATEEEIINACKLANCHDFIIDMPNGYHTVLQKNGSNLSHGQRQLLAIARTILKNPDILILDEATSSVDTMTEQKIQTAIANLTKNKTSFIIAHRLSTIRNADLIIVMDGGKIAEQGTHKELLKQKGLYFKLHNAIEINIAE